MNTPLATQIDHRLLQRDHVRPLAARTTCDVPITEEHLRRKMRQLEPDEFDAYQAVVTAGRISSLEHLDRFCGTVGKFTDRKPDVLCCLLEVELIRYCSLSLAEGFLVNFFEPSPVLDETVERNRTTADRKAESERANRAVVLDALREAEAVCTVAELKPFATRPLSDHLVRKALLQLVEAGMVENRTVAITPRRSATCYVIAEQANQVVSDLGSATVDDTAPISCPSELSVK